MKYKEKIKEVHNGNRDKVGEGMNKNQQNI